MDRHYDISRVFEDDALTSFDIEARRFVFRILKQELGFVPKASELEIKRLGLNDLDNFHNHIYYQERYIGTFQLVIKSLPDPIFFGSFQFLPTAHRFSSNFLQEQIKDMQEHLRRAWEEWGKP